MRPASRIRARLGALGLAALAVALGWLVLRTGAPGGARLSAGESVPLPPVESGPPQPPLVAALRSPAVSEILAGRFERIGFHLPEAGGSLTAVVEEDGVHVEEGVDPTGVDLVVDLEPVALERLAAAAQLPPGDPRARFGVVAALLPPAARATLARPLVSQPLVRSLVFGLGAEPRLAHVTLEAPPGERPLAFTIARVDDQTLVLEGHFGAPDARYRLDVDSLLDLDTRLRSAREADSLWGWMRFADWYAGFIETSAEPG